jgi:hypothetical protein
MKEKISLDWNSLRTNKFRTHVIRFSGFSELNSIGLSLVWESNTYVSVKTYCYDASAQQHANTTGILVSYSRRIKVKFLFLCLFTNTSLTAYYSKKQLSFITSHKNLQLNCIQNLLLPFHTLILTFFRFCLIFLSQVEGSSFCCNTSYCSCYAHYCFSALGRGMKGEILLV